MKSVSHQKEVETTMAVRSFENLYAVLAKSCQGLFDTAMRLRLRFLQLAMISYLLMGALFVVTLPAFQAPDEFAHWETANQRYDTTFRNTDAHCHAVTTLASQLGIEGVPTNASQKVPTGRIANFPESYAGCSRQFPEVNYGIALTYAPTLLARSVVKGEENKHALALQTYQLARILSVLFFFFSLARLVRLEAKAPQFFGSWFVFFALLSPMALQQTSAVTADFSGLLSALWVYMIIAHYQRLRAMDFLSFAAIAITAVASKPMVLTLIVLPVFAVFGLQLFQRMSAASRWTFKDICAPILHSSRFRTLAAVCLGTGLLGAYLGLNLAGSTNGDKRIAGVDAAAQINHIKNHPAETLGLLSQTAHTSLRLDTSFYNPLGWLDTPVRKETRVWHNKIMRAGLIIDALVLIALAILFLPALVVRVRAMARQRGMRTTALRWLGLLAVLGLVFAVIYSASFVSSLLNTVAMYLMWTKVGENLVSGLQGRYFLPNIIVQYAAMLAVASYVFRILVDRLSVDQFAPAGDTITPTRRSINLSEVCVGAATVVFAVGFARYATLLLYDLSWRFW